MQRSEWKFNASSRKSGFYIHKMTKKTGWRYPAHSHRGFSEITCVTHGSIQQIINGKEFRQNAGTLVLIRETDIHELAGHNFVYFNIMFQTEWINRLEFYTQFQGMAKTLLDPNRKPPAGNIPPKLIPKFENALDGLLSNPATLQGRRLFSIFLLDTLTRHIMPPVEPNLPEGMPEWLMTPVQALSQPGDRFPSLSELIRQSGRSHEHFTREFKKYMKKSPSTHLAELKIERASEMLVTTNHKIIDIGHRAGFANESYFHRLFKRRTGKSPGEYRRAFGPRSLLS